MHLVYGERKHRCKARPLLILPMNVLLVGRDKTPLLDHLPTSYLLIDDGPLIDAITIPAHRKVTYFDVHKHSFDILKRIDYPTACNISDTLCAAFPGGQNTLTKESANIQILDALLSKPKHLSTLLPTGKQYAYAQLMIDRILLSPVLRNVLTKPTNFSFEGILLVRLNRAELGDFDCFLLANLLIGQYKGHVIIPDFGFYACPFHVSLRLQNRLIAGVNYLDEAPAFREQLLLIDHKIASHCTAQDAETLAQYTGLLPDTNAYNDFIARSIK